VRRFFINGTWRIPLKVESYWNWARNVTTIFCFVDARQWFAKEMELGQFLKIANAVSARLREIVFALL